MTEHQEVRVVVSGGSVTTRTEAAGPAPTAERPAADEGGVRVQAPLVGDERSATQDAGADDAVCCHGWAAMPAQARKNPRIDPARA